MDRLQRVMAVCWRAPLLFCLATCVACSALAQDSDLLSIQQDDQFLVMMPSASSEKQFLSSGETQITLEFRDKIFRYKAVKGDSIVYSDWIRTTSNQPWLAYLPSSKKFQEVSNRVVVRLKDTDQLDTIAKELNAIRFKHYEHMGYSVLWLDKGENPARVVLRLNSDDRVGSAKVQFSELRRFPW